MAEVTYTSVTWTTGDVITEAKMDNMVANDRAVDAMNNGVEFVERSDPSTPGTNKIHLYAKDKSGVSTLYWIESGGTAVQVAERLFTFEFPIGYPVAGSAVIPPLIVPVAMTIVKAYAYASTAPTGADLIFDINKNGTSIWNSTQGNRVKVTDGNQSGSQTSFDTTALTEADILTIDVDQVGSTVAGDGVVIALKCK